MNRPAITITLARPTRPAWSVTAVMARVRRWFRPGQREAGDRITDAAVDQLVASKAARRELIATGRFPSGSDNDWLASAAFRRSNRTEGDR